MELDTGLENFARDIGFTVCEFSGIHGVRHLHGIDHVIDIPIMHRKRDPIAVEPDVPSIRMDISVEVLFFDRAAIGKKLKILVIWRIFVIKIAENDILWEVVVFDVARVGGDDSDLAVFVLALLLNGDDAGRDGVS